ncbi:MAG: amidohydrolase family protein [Candidatus Bathyarchaeia archaeon]
MVDLLIKNGIVVTMDPNRRILERHSLTIDDGRVVEIGKTEELQKRHSNVESLDATGQIVMPGLICSHSHLYGILLRGASLSVTPPSDLTQILQRIWWPLDEAMNYEDAYASALIASVEFAKSGVTMFADTYSGPNSIHGVLDRICDAVESIGIRSFLAFEATERHSKVEGLSGVKENARFAEIISKKPDSKARALFSIHASFTVSDELIHEVKKTAERFHSPITIHASEGLGDLHHNLENYGKRTIERLSDVGLLGSNVILAHCVHLNSKEIDLIAKTRTGVAHNPMSNMLNAVGVSPVQQMIAQKVTVGLGNDGYIFDMFENMRTAFLLHRLWSKDPNAIDSYTVLEMATINGAKLYGMEKDVGSIEVGKKADIILIRPNVLPTPLTSDTVVGHIINTVDGDDVEHVFVGGQQIVKNKQLLSFDEQKAQKISQTAAANLWTRLRTATAQVDRAHNL